MKKSLSNIIFAQTLLEVKKSISVLLLSILGTWTVSDGIQVACASCTATITQTSTVDDTFETIQLMFEDTTGKPMPRNFDAATVKSNSATNAY